MLSYDAYKNILGITEKVNISDKEMADSLNITFFPHSNIQTVSQSTIDFVENLKKTFIGLKVNIIPYEEALNTIPVTKIVLRILKTLVNNISYFFESLFKKEKTHIYINLASLKNLAKQKRIKKGISVIAIGESTTGNLPIDNTLSFQESSVITIIDWPKHITEASQFEDHFDAAMSLFAHHMTNIIVAVSEKKWLLYNFNASHPVYDRKEKLEQNVLHALIPKIAAPIRPIRLNQLTILKETFDPFDKQHTAPIHDLVESAQRFNDTKLYPSGKKINDLPFRNDFYRWIGKIHLDERNGMSFGFLACQMPLVLSNPIPIDEAKKKYGSAISDDKDYFFDNQGNLHILIDCFDEFLCLQIPEVWVLSQRSGSNKTNIDPQKDLVKIGLKNGKMCLQIPHGLMLTPDYKTSFDTQVILAHAVGNAIIASLLNYKNSKHEFVRHALKQGFGLAHWHGYFRPDSLPNGWFLHGVLNPHVSCSSPQSAIYAIHGKLNAFNEHQEGRKDPINYKGDVHVEPHHGTNIVFSSLKELVDLFLANKECVSLGNQYLSLYPSE